MHRSRPWGTFTAWVLAFITTTYHADGVSGPFSLPSTHCRAYLMRSTGVSGQGTWETTLQARDLDGNWCTPEAYYDTVLNITWLADASHPETSGYGNAMFGLMYWPAADAWAKGLNINGVTGWRLPINNPIDGTTADDTKISYIGTEDMGFNVSAPGTAFAGKKASEMAHLFYNTLGNKSPCDPSTSTEGDCNGQQTGFGLTNTGPFINFHSYGYWSATEYAPDTSMGWYFAFSYGSQLSRNKYTMMRAWAVHPGDVGKSIEHAWLVSPPYPPPTTDVEGLQIDKSH